MKAENLGMGGENTKKRTFLLLIACGLSVCLSAAVLSSCKKANGPPGPDPVTEVTTTRAGNPSAIGAPVVPGDDFPAICIETEGKRKIVSKTEYLKATVGVDGADEEFCFAGASAKVRARGNGTYKMAKLSFRLSFDEKVNLFGQGGAADDDWLLLANYTDRTMIRDHLMLTAAKMLDRIEWSSSSSFVHLYVNGAYEGVYQLIEEHETGANRIRVDENVNVVDTDYLIELDNYADEDERVEGIEWFYGETFPYGDGKPRKYRIHSEAPSGEKCAFLADYFHKIDEAVASGRKSKIAELIDLDSFVDTYILHEFMKNTDTGFSSFFMVKRAGDKVYFTCPWDFDLSSGNDHRVDNGGYKNLFVGNASSAMKQIHPWYAALMQEGWFRQLVRDRWAEVGKSIYEAEIDEIERLMIAFRDDFELNYTVWNPWNKRQSQEPSAVVRIKTFVGQIDYLKTWLDNRFVWLDEEWKNGSGA